MKKLFSGRHGKYSLNLRLSDTGRDQIRYLADAISRVLEGGSIHLVTSTAQRAIDSGEIIASHFGLTGFDRVEYLFCGNGAPYGIPTFDSYRGADRIQRLLAVANDRRELA